MKSSGKKQTKADIASSVGPSAQNPKRPDSWRETIESIVVAFVLAFLFRTFEAEAFVIPTGSMALTLMGQHKDLECPECGFRFQTSVHETNPRVGSCVCPNCRYLAEFDSESRDGDEPRTYKG